MVYWEYKINQTRRVMKNLKFQSVFDIIGPVMVGPSSSHTAGAVRIGKIVSAIFGDAPTEVNFNFLIPLQKPIEVMGQMWLLWLVF